MTGRKDKYRKSRMANENDSFIDEVTEDLRRDRLFAAFRRYGWIAGLVILAIVGGAAWREYSRARRLARRRPMAMPSSLRKSRPIRCRRLRRLIRWAAKGGVR